MLQQLLAPLHLPVAALFSHAQTRAGHLLQGLHHFPAVLEAFPWDDTCLFTAISSTRGQPLYSQRGQDVARLAPPL